MTKNRCFKCRLRELSELLTGVVGSEYLCDGCRVLIIVYNKYIDISASFCVASDSSS